MENYNQGNLAAGYATIGGSQMNNRAMKHAIAAQQAQQAAYAGDACPPRQSEMDAIGQRLAAVLNTLMLHNDRLQNVSDRLNGSELSKEAGGQPPRPVPNGLIAQFNMALDVICERLDRAENLASRINSAI